VDEVGQPGVVEPGANDRSRDDAADARAEGDPDVPPHHSRSDAAESPDDRWIAPDPLSPDWSPSEWAPATWAPSPYADDRSGWYGHATARTSERYPTSGAEPYDIDRSAAPAYVTRDPHPSDPYGFAPIDVPDDRFGMDVDLPSTGSSAPSGSSAPPGSPARSSETAAAAGAYGAADVYGAAGPADPTGLATGRASVGDALLGRTLESPVTMPSARPHGETVGPGPRAPQPYVPRPRPSELHRRPDSEPAAPETLAMPGPAVPGPAVPPAVTTEAVGAQPTEAVGPQPTDADVPPARAPERPEHNPFIGRSAAGGTAVAQDPGLPRQAAASHRPPEPDPSDPDRDRPPGWRGRDDRTPIPMPPGPASSRPSGQSGVPVDESTAVPSGPPAPPVPTASTPGPHDDAPTPDDARPESSGRADTGPPSTSRREVRGEVRRRRGPWLRGSGGGRVGRFGGRPVPMFSSRSPYLEVPPSDEDARPSTQGDASTAAPPDTPIAAPDPIRGDAPPSPLPSPSPSPSMPPPSMSGDAATVSGPDTPARAVQTGPPAVAVRPPAAAPMPPFAGRRPSQVDEAWYGPGTGADVAEPPGAAEEDWTDRHRFALIDQPSLPHRVPARPDVPFVEPADLAPDVPDEISSIPSADVDGPELSRIATHLRTDEESVPDLPDELDVGAVLAAVRQVDGVRSAQLRPNPGGVHILRLDLADDADAGRVSRQVARLLKERMGLAAEPRRPAAADPVVDPATNAVAAPATDAVAAQAVDAGPAAPIATSDAAAPTSAAPTSPAPTLQPRMSAAPAPVAPRSRSDATTVRMMPTTATGDAASAPSTESVAASLTTPAPTYRPAMPNDPGAFLPGMSSVPRPTTLPPVPGQAPRLVLDQVRVSTVGTEATVEVRMHFGDVETVGRASGPAVDTYLLRLAAQAAAGAIDSLMASAGVGADSGEPPVRCFIEHAGVVPFGTSVVAVVVVLASGDGRIEQLVGSALVSGDPRASIVRATLAAVNRRVESLLM
jgi:hypothetical protein